jgi:hypothetical protein
MSEEYVYLADSGALMLGIHKIGRSIDPKRRVRTQYVPGHRLHPHFIEAWQVDDAAEVEHAAHTILNPRRFCDEWFSVSEDEAREAITQAINLFGPPQDAAVRRHERKAQVSEQTTELCPCGEDTPAGCAERPTRHCGADQTTDWQARSSAVREAEGDEWDRLSDAYDLDWKAAYCAEFRRFAVERGWTQDNIESGWLDSMPDEALIAYGGRSGFSPQTAAQDDVKECELACI